MLFNSPEYMLFLPIVFLLYWLTTRSARSQNALLLLVSYIFYGWWDWRFLGLIFGASVMAYTCGRLIERYSSSTRACKAICAANILVSFGILGVYKYYNFFAANLAVLARSLGFEPGWVTLELVLPVGISFYTFQAVGYTIDVYRRNVAAERNIVTFLAFISFFPQLVAGPIERAAALLPQFRRRRTFDYDEAVDGLRRILWGLFKKMVVADNCAQTVDWAFANYQTTGGLNLVAGAVLFSIQMYCDFSGYSDIALGSARLLGIRLMTNFRFPYFSRSIAEFWSRWHISLTTWFRDYVYIPLGGNRHGLNATVRNTVAVFLISGFWHGADWTFIAWGAFNAMLFVPLLYTGTSRKYKRNTVAEGRLLPSAGEVTLMAVTFALVVAGRVLYRAESLPAAGAIFRKMFTDFRLTGMPHETMVAVYIAAMFAVEWTHRTCDYGFDIKGHGLMRYRPWRWFVYLVLTLAVLLCAGRQESFIYFQF